MKNHRFLWLRNRTTNNRKCEKARNIKEKRTIEMFSTASKQLVAHPSSPSADTIPYQQMRFADPRFYPGVCFLRKAVTLFSDGIADFTLKNRILRQTLFFCRKPLDFFPGK